jgi:hypothetical protein
MSCALLARRRAAVPCSLCAWEPFDASLETIDVRHMRSWRRFTVPFRDNQYREPQIVIIQSTMLCSNGNHYLRPTYDLTSLYA